MNVKSKMDFVRLLEVMENAVAHARYVDRGFKSALGDTCQWPIDVEELNGLVYPDEDEPCDIAIFGRHCRSICELWIVVSGSLMVIAESEDERGCARSFLSSLDEISAFRDLVFAITAEQVQLEPPTDPEPLSQDENLEKVKAIADETPVHKMAEDELTRMAKMIATEKQNEIDSNNLTGFTPAQEFDLKLQAIANVLSVEVVQAKGWRWMREVTGCGNNAVSASKLRAKWKETAAENALGRKASEDDQADFMINRQATGGASRISQRVHI